MEVLKGEVKKIFFYSQDNGYTAFLFHLKEENITACGYLGELYPGEELELKGKWKNHPKYGRQFWVEEAVRKELVSLEGIKGFLTSNLIKGIGEKTGEKLIEAFGSRVLEVLDDSPEELLQIEGIGPKKLEQIVSSWKSQQNLRNLVLFLQSHGISTGYVQKIINKYGQEAIAKIKQNPYTLAKDIRGIGFKRADSMALKLGLSKDSFFRLEAGVFYLLKELAEKGNLFYPQEELVELLKDLLEVEEEVILSALEEMAAQKKIFILDLKEQGLKKAVYLSYFYSLEQELASRIYHLATFPLPNIQLKNLEEKIKKVEQEQKINLTPEQREAVRLALENKVFILTGGPGTGKTTITKIIVKLFQTQDYKIKLCAPTGRAAKRLEESTYFPASTIHRLLKAKPEGGFELGEENKLKAEVVIVDEVSMLDAPLFLALLRALPLTCRLILIGDINQLPAIGPGNVLSDLLESETIASKRLTSIFRQAKESFIVLNAHRINEGKLPLKSKLEAPYSDFFWIEKEDPVASKELVLKMVSERIPKIYGFDPKKEVQVLTPMHKGELGTISLNQALQARLNSGKNKRIKRGQIYFSEGDRVIQLANNYEKQVFNGDLGFITRVWPEEGSLEVDFDGQKVLYSREDLEELSLAYAVSIHKSQGSEFPVIVMVLATQHFVLLQRNLIYTGLTRARKLAVLIGSKKALFIGLNKKGLDKRYTNLRFILQKLFNN
ncbi:MAG: exodeoxyribonuclease alpha subunit [Desulfonauticus sp.]|jgi:exodeoxyribonuclease V alpha subunit|nr:exodeoxyribonuclease alpha subunit [Desulfonauticus sp.]